MLSLIYAHAQPLKHFEFKVHPLIAAKKKTPSDVPLDAAPLLLRRRGLARALLPSKQALRANGGKANRVFAQGTKVWEIWAAFVLFSQLQLSSPRAGLPQVSSLWSGVRAAPRPGREARTPQGSLPAEQRRLWINEPNGHKLTASGWWAEERKVILNGVSGQACADRAEFGLARRNTL